MTWRVIAATLVWWYALDLAIHYGGIWETRAQPTPGVEVTFANGSKLTGAWSLAWSGEEVLILPTGGELHFTTYESMTVPYPVNDRPFPWRSFLPMALLCIGPLAWALALWLRSLASATGAAGARHAAH